MHGSTQDHDDIHGQWAYSGTELVATGHLLPSLVKLPTLGHVKDASAGDAMAVAERPSVSDSIQSDPLN